MQTRDARGGSRRLQVVLVACGALLIVLPILLGFQVARAGSVTFSTETEAPQVTAPLDPGSGTLPEAVAGGSGQDPVTVSDALTRLSDDEVKSRLKWMRDDGISVAMLNGGTIPLGNGYEVAVTVDPYPPVNFNPVTVAITLTRDGVPVRDAGIAVQYDMLYMKHGPFPIDLAPDAAGTYTASYYFFMFGPWGITAQVQAPGEAPMSFTISILVWPN